MADDLTEMGEDVGVAEAATVEGIDDPLAL
jgi:hypothetical protein